MLVAVLGDDDPEVRGHIVIDRALRHAAETLALDVDVCWLPTAALEPDVRNQLAPYDALWAGPCSPYENIEGVLGAIRFARESGRPFLGTCAGFQHAIIEYARTVLGFPDADHAETSPAATRPFVVALARALFERTALVVLDPASRTARIYRRTEIAERYRCRFGANPAYLSALHKSGLRVTGVNEDGAATVIELAPHPFFLATLFMPERSSRPGAPHPLIVSYLEAASHLQLRALSA